MSRPTSLLKDATLYWVIRLYDSSGALVDADSTPTVAVRKNGASVGDSVTVTKRSATTGIYDCSYNPASEVEGDQFTIEESVTISSTSYSHSWSLRVVDPERGTDSAYTGTPPTASTIASQVRTELTTELAHIDADVSSRLSTASYTEPLDAAGVRTAVGLAAANLDTQLATIDSVVDAIVIDTTEIGAAGAGLTAVPWNAAWDAEVQSEVADALAVYDPPTKTELDSGLASLNDLSTADIDARLAAYDGPTNTEMIAAFTEIKGAGWSATTDTLEKIRDASGGGASSDSVLVLVSTTIATLTSQTVFTLTIGSSDNDAYNNAIAIITDQSTSLQKAFVRVLDYVGSTKALTLAKLPQFTVAAGDSIAILAIHPSQQGVQYPLAGTYRKRIDNSKITVYLNETVEVGPIPVLDGNGDPLDMSGMDLTFVVENKSTKVDLATYAVELTGVGNDQFVATVDTDVTGAEGTYGWALRQNIDSTKVVLKKGEINVEYAADADA